MELVDTGNGKGQRELMETQGGFECVFMGRMVGLADGVGSDVTPDMARMSVTIAKRLYHTRFFLLERMVD